MHTTPCFLGLDDFSLRFDVDLRSPTPPRSLRAVRTEHTDIMKGSLYDRIWRRESGEVSRYASLRGIYGSKEWIDDLDIVNELSGHTGCVNALCWSNSGRLLASGSDDTYLNLYSYQPESSTAPFALNTTLMTGHSANIFSVKFMPHSNDQTLVTCAGDSQVRVFDIEHSGRSSDSSAFGMSARSNRFNHFFDGARYLSEGNSNARVYRSHADRVKRIVTESSPFLFITCSEDGEVRQWDLRQPSSAYPQPRGGQGFMAYRPGLSHDDSNVPPPLISYKRHQLDLNTISCSPSQPHYIALGGAHLHCFLHDRRMLGRDLQVERGDPGSSSPPGSVSSTSRGDEAMDQATRCVRRFAPEGKKRMRPRDNGHITACKISDANPNEMIASWSGDHIYSFDLVRSPDARDDDDAQKSSRENPITGISHSRRRRGSKSKIKKRKRQGEGEGGSRPSSQGSGSGSGSGDRHGSRRRSGERESGAEDEDEDDGELAFRVRYGNGESEDIPLPALSETISDAPEEVIERARNAMLSDAQRLSMRIAKGLVKLRRALFSLETSVREFVESSDLGMGPFTSAFSAGLTYASSYLPRMTEIMNAWSYPLHPSPEMVRFQQQLRRNRESAWRFVQAAGTVSRVLGGIDGDIYESEDESESDDAEDHDTNIDIFQQIKPAPGENDSIDPKAQFSYDFLKALCLWVEGGRRRLLNGFQNDAAPSRRNQARFPIPAGTADDGDIESRLIPYLQGLAGDAPVVNVDASRFEHDSTRILFPNQHAALTAFANAVRLPLEHLGNTAARVDGGDDVEVQALDRTATKRFWILKVGRGILMEAGSGVNYEFVNRAFGGLRVGVENEEEERVGQEQERSQDDVDANLEEEPIRDIGLIRTGSSSERRGSVASGSAGDNDDHNHDMEDSDEESDMSSYQGSDPYNSDEDEDDDDDDPEAVEIAELLSGSNGFPRARREDVELDAPCDSHTRTYRGHCNVKTVKDVNFFGLNDEYVVSGCDSGNLFIWDRQSGDLINILEGDSEVVNVVQGICHSRPSIFTSTKSID